MPLFIIKINIQNKLYVSIWASYIMAVSYLHNLITAVLREAARRRKGSEALWHHVGASAGEGKSSSSDMRRSHALYPHMSLLAVLLFTVSSG